MTLDAPGAPTPVAAASGPDIPAPRRSVPGLIGDFFTFRVIIGPALIRFIYPCGMLLGSAALLAAALLNAAAMAYFRPGLALILAVPVTLFAIVLFNALWRVTCELLLLRYEINARLSSLMRKRGTP